MPDFNFPYPHWQVSTLNCLTSQAKHADSSQRPSLITSTLRKPLQHQGTLLSHLYFTNGINCCVSLQAVEKLQDYTHANNRIQSTWRQN